MKSIKVIQDNDRFVTISISSSQGYGMYKVVVDAETGVHYLASGEGITPLLDSSGRVMIDRRAIDRAEEGNL